MPYYGNEKFIFEELIGFLADSLQKRYSLTQIISLLGGSQANDILIADLQVKLTIHESPLVSEDSKRS